MGNQRGFTLITLTVALAITGIISLGASMSIVHLMKGTTYNRNQTAAIEQLQNAGQWISNDARMAQSLPGLELGDTLGFPLTLGWKEYGTDGTDGIEYEIVYAVTSSSLERREYRDTNPDPWATTVVARYVDLSESSFDLFVNPDTDVATLTLNLTSKAGTGSGEESETRTYEVVCKPYIPQE